MKIASTRQAGVCVVSISGNVDSLTSAEAGAFLDEQIKQGNTRLVLALAGVKYMSSSGLRVLMTAFKAACQQKGDVYLAAVQENILQLLDLAGFTSIFKIYPTAEEAVSAFEGV